MKATTFLTPVKAKVQSILHPADASTASALAASTTPTTKSSSVGLWAGLVAIVAIGWYFITKKGKGNRKSLKY